MSTFPFRTEPHGQASAKFLREVSRVRSADQSKREEWAAHPEEVVAARLAHTTWLQTERLGGASEIRAQLFMRAAKTAGDEGHYWNPVIDGVYRGPRVIEYDIKLVANREDIDPSKYLSLLKGDILAPLQRWLDEYENADAGKELLKFKYPRIAEEVASRSVIDKELALKLVEKNDELSIRIARNERLSEEGAEALFAWCMKNLTAPASKSRKGMERGEAIGRLDACGLRPAKREDIDRLLSSMKKRRGKRTSRLEPVVHALCELNAHLTNEDVEKMLPFVSKYGWLVVSLADAPAMDIEQARHLLDNCRMTQLRAVMSRRADFRRDEQIREVLLRSTNKRSLANLIQDASDEELADLVSRFLEEPYFALHVLEKRPTVAKQMKPADLLPLLRHDKQEIRVRAMQISGLLTEG